MNERKQPERSAHKPTVEFDMFVRDLEPEEEERIKGGSSGESARRENAAERDDRSDRRSN